MGAIPTARGRSPRRKLQASSAFALSIAHRIEATVLDGVNLSPQSRTARESHCHQDPHFQVPGEVPAPGAKDAERGGLRAQVYPEERTVNERNVASVPSVPIRIITTITIITIIIIKASSFICRKTFCPEKERVPPHPADPPEEGMRSKTSTFSGISERKAKLLQGAARSLAAQRLAR